MPRRLISAVLAPLLLWSAHFFGCYGLALALPTHPLLDPLILTLTLAAGVAIVLMWRASAAFDVDRLIARQAIAIAALAIAWQGLVILF